VTNLFSRLCLALSILVLSGCPDYALQIQAQTANAVAQAANTELPVLVGQFRQDGMDALVTVKQKGGTEDQARAELARIEVKWAPVWKGWDALRAAHDAWATALEKGGDYAAALIGLSKAYCSFMILWPQAVPVIPLAPVLCPVAEAPKP